MKYEKCLNEKGELDASLLLSMILDEEIKKQIKLQEIKTKKEAKLKKDTEKLVKFLQIKKNSYKVY